MSGAISGPENQCPSPNFQFLDFSLLKFPEYTNFPIFGRYLCSFHFVSNEWIFWNIEFIGQKCVNGLEKSLKLLITFGIGSLW